MKKSIFVLITASFLFSSTAGAQGLLKKVTGAMKDELLGTGKNSSKEAEPSCACADAELVVGLGGKYQLNYKEMNISTMDDGSLLMQDKMSGDYYIIRTGTIIGPVRAGDQRLAGFENTDDTDPMEAMVRRYKEYISRSGDKYMISFGGKSYGPFALISQFIVPQSKDKFAAIVVESIPVSEADGKKMDTAIENAKTEQEKRDLAMQFTQQLQQKVMESGGPEAMTPKIISSIEGVTINPITGGTISGRMKYDEILASKYDKISDLQGKTVMTLKPEFLGVDKIFINTSNTKYAVDSYGTLTFSDKTTLTDLFNPHLIKVGGQVYLAYMYYSPKKNAFMQCKIPF
jgi:hypothetical protein